MKQETKDAVLVVGLATLAAALIAFAVGCTRIEYVDRPSPVPVPTPGPTPATAMCHSVPIEQGDCHKTSDDIYLNQYTIATDAAARTPLVSKDEITDGPGYLQFIIDNLRAQGMCAGIYRQEEIAVWSKTDGSFSENWDAVVEPGDGRILQRTGPGAHSWTCNPATTERGSTFP